MHVALLDRHGLEQVERLALGNSFHYIDQDDIGQFLGSNPVCRGRAHVARADNAYFLTHEISPWRSIPKIGSALHVSDDARREFARSDLGSAGSLALKVVGHKLLLNGLLHRIFNQLGCLFPTDEIQQHDARQDDRTRIDHVLVGVLRRSAMRCFEYGEAIADVSARRNAQATHLRSGSVGDVVAVEVGRRQNAVVGGPNDDLLEDGIGNAVVDEDLVLPRPVAVRFADRIEHSFDFGIEFVAKCLVPELEARLDECRVFFNRDAGVRIDIAEDPALALRHGLIAEFLHRHFVAPFPKCAFSELLDVALVNERDSLAAGLDGVADRVTYQALGAEDGDRLDADARVARGSSSCRP